MRACVTAILAFGLTGLVAADDKKADPTGTWKWTAEFNGQKMERSVKLKLEDGKLTGTMPGRDGQETKIEDGTFKDGEVAFSVARERNGQKSVTKYKATVDGDTMKGTSESNRGGETRKQEFTAKREKSSK